MKKTTKKTENPCQNAACEQKCTSEKWKLGSNKQKRPRMNYEWIGETISKKNWILNIEKTVNIIDEIAAYEQKTTGEKANTVLLLYFKIRARKNHFFALHFLFRLDQNHYSNLTSKMKMSEQILRKNIARRIPETTRRRKLPILMTRQLQQLL